MTGTDLSLLCCLGVDGSNAAWMNSRHTENECKATLHDTNVPPRRSGILPRFFKDELELGETEHDDLFLLPPQIVINDN